MELDLVNGIVIISMGLFILLVGLAAYGLAISGAMLAVAVASYAQRRDNVKEIKRYNAFLAEITAINKIWHGDPNAEFAFPGLPDSPIVAVGTKRVDDYPDKEFLEDRG